MFYLGIDAGGTKTALALGDETQVLATATVKSIKLGTVPKAQARAALREGVQDVCDSASVRPEAVRACVAGLSGASIASSREFVMKELSSALGVARCAVYGDHVIAHRAAFPEGEGVLTISGTGSICYGRARDGREMRAGGHGPAISDEGSGTWIGRELLRRLFRAHDVGFEVAALDDLVQRYGNGDGSEVIRKANAGEIVFADLVPVVLDGAQAKNVVMLDLLRDAGTELGALANDVAGHLFDSGHRVRFALSGSVAQQALVREGFLNEIMRLWKDAEWVEGKLSAAEGAWVMARELAGEKEAKPMHQ